MNAPVLVLSLLKPDGTLLPYIIDVQEPTADERSLALLQVSSGETGINVPLTLKTLHALSVAIDLIGEAQ